jgi:phospholipid/cholesterol/gamma-HCH transport system permease protein
MKTPADSIIQCGGMVYQLKEEIVSLISFLGDVTAAMWEGIRHPKRIRWRDVLFYMNTCGPDGLPITIMISGLMGVVLAYQAEVQSHKYGADNFLPMVIGCTILRELGPLMVAIVATGRSGSSFAAEIGTMKISEELDALRTMGIRPARFLVVPKMWAMLLMLPLLTAIGDFVGCAGGYMVMKTELGMPLDVFLRLTRQGVAVKYFIEGILKSVAFAYIITVTGCWRGFRTGNDAIAVGRSTTSAVVTSILFIVLADAFLAKLFTVFYGWQG